MDHVKRAGELFLSGYNCAQSVFAAFADAVGMTEESALRLSSPFGGGMGRMREVCGACSGMFLVLGATGGYDTPDDEAKSKLYARVQSLADAFRAKHGTIICRDLLAGFNVESSSVPTPRTPEFYSKRPCLGFIISAAEIIEAELIVNQNKK